MIPLLIPNPISEIGKVLLCDGRIVTREGPNSIENIIGCSSANETCRVGEVFVDAGLFFEQIGNAKIDEYTTAADYTKFDELS